MPESRGGGDGPCEDQVRGVLLVDRELEQGPAVPERGVEAAFDLVLTLRGDVRSTERIAQNQPRVPLDVLVDEHIGELLPEER